jgi:hypothetical protein
VDGWVRKYFRMGLTAGEGGRLQEAGTLGERVQDAGGWDAVVDQVVEYGWRFLDARCRRMVGKNRTSGIGRRRHRVQHHRDWQQIQHRHKRERVCVCVCERERDARLSVIIRERGFLEYREELELKQ